MRYSEIIESHREWVDLLAPRTKEIEKFIIDNYEDKKSPWHFTFPFKDKKPSEITDYLDRIVYSVVDEDHGRVLGAFVADRASHPEIILYFPGWKPFPNLHELIVHELRHAIQYVEYRDYFYLKKDKFTYGEDPTEIDASFHQYLVDVEKEQVQDGKVFADKVMAKMIDHKDLTPKQIGHFRAKAAKYWLERQDGKDSLEVGRERRKAAKDQLDGNAKEWLLRMYDLRDWNLADVGAEGTITLIRNEWIEATVKSILNGRPISGQFLDIFTIMTAIMIHLGNPPPNRIKRMIDFNSTISHIKDGSFPIRGDKLVQFLEEIKNHI